MDFSYDAATESLRERVLAFMDDVIHPSEAEFHRQAVEAERAGGVGAWTRPPLMTELRAEARRRGLWNLFLPGNGPGKEHGAGLTNLQYAPLAEIMGRSLGIAPESMNCNAPDTGNMEVLAQFGTEEQKRTWLLPLLQAEIRSSFLMTEPDVASSDAANIRCTVHRDGDHYVVNGRKWWSTGAMDPDCAVFIVMGQSDPDAPRYQRQSMVLVPRDTPGVTVERGLSVFGYTDGAHGGHAEVSLDDVRVPASNILAGAGQGFRIAQERLGPGRIHHCMRTIGVAERALELMCRRVSERVAFGRPIASQGVVQEWVAESRIRIEQVRLLTLKTAWLMDTVGNKGARTEIAAIKVAAPAMASYVLDRAIQAHGGGGVSGDFPLASLWAQVRTLHLADGPDEVHRRTIARNELAPFAPTT